MVSVGANQPSIGSGLPPGGNAGQVLAKRSSASNDTGWTDTLTRSATPNYLNTNYYDNRVAGVAPTSNAAFVADTVYCTAFFTPVAVSVASIGCFVSTASLSGTMVVGISTMRTSVVAPGTLFASTAAMATTATGSVLAALPANTVIPAGWSWFSAVANQACSVTAFGGTSNAPPLPISWAFNNGSAPVAVTSVSNMWKYSSSTILSDPTITSNGTGGACIAFTFKPS